MSVSDHLKRHCLSLYGMVRFGFQRERIMSRSAEMTVRRWNALTNNREATDLDMNRLVDRLQWFEQSQGRRPNEQETDVIIQHILNFPVHTGKDGS